MGNRMQLGLVQLIFFKQEKILLVDANLRLITSPISLETEDLLKIGTAKLSPQLKTSVAHDEYPRLASLDLAVSVSRSFTQIQSTIITYLYNLRNN